ncbi:neprilysin-2-like isoform X2 [Prorops nasuta]|uniref:neprilysin-2-like isoform X2 n=1 Tax=Prorops nasuta TaxID=863751 RepID=UPI0034CE2A43
MSESYGFSLGTTVLGRTLLDLSNDDTIFVDSNLSDFPWFKRHLPNINGDKRTQSNVICQTEECKNIGKFILANMNKSVNPCDDFYEYACGNSKISNPVPNWSDSWSTTHFMYENILLKKREILEAKVEHDDTLPLKLSKKWYKACMNEETMKDRGLSSIASIVSRIGGWPLAMEKGEWNLLDKPFKKVEKYYTNIIGASTFFNYKVLDKSLSGEHNKPFIMIEVPILPLEAYLKFPREKIYTQSDGYYQRTIIKIAKKIAKHTDTILSEKKLTKDVNDLINFENELFKIRNIEATKKEDESDSTHSEDDCFDKDKEESKNDDDDCIALNKTIIDETTKILGRRKNNQEQDFNKRVNKKNKYIKKLNKKLNKHRNNSHQNLLEKMERLSFRLNKISKRRDYNNKNSQQVDNFKRQKRDVAINDWTFERKDEDIYELLDQILLRSKLNNKKNKVIQIKINKKNKLNKATENDDTVGKDSKLNDSYEKNINASTEDREKENEILNCNDSNDDDECNISENDSNDNFEQDEFDIEEVSSEMTELFRECFEDLLEEIDVNIDDVLIVPFINDNQLFEYFELLKKTPNEVIVNFIHWNFISRMYLLTKDLTCTILDCFPNPKQIPRWKGCVDEVKMTEAISYEYVKKYFHTEASNITNGMIDVMKNATKLEIEGSTWLDEDMKKDAKEKVDKIKEYIGYPEWFDNNTAFENHFRGLIIVGNNFDNSLSYERFKKIWEFEKLSQDDGDFDVWTIVKPTQVNAYYLRFQNSIVFPAAVFEFPWFSISYPDAINFGMLGFLTSHEVSHGFGPTSRTYDKNGKEFKWDEQMEKEYMTRLDCFIEQYNSYSLEVGNITVNADGKKTLNENVADVTGISIIYKAFKLWTEIKETPDLKLPGFEDFTEEQMLFLSTANAFCETVKPSNFIAKIKSSTHSIGSFRINGVLSNSEEFSKTFSCPVGSKMNPEKKCDIWK